MRPLWIVGGIVLAFLLTFASLPWVCWSMGCAVIGDEAAADRAMEATPLWRYMDWLDGR